MKLTAKWNNLLLATTAGFLAALAIASATQPLLANAGWMLRLVLSGACLALLAGGVILHALRRQRDQQAAQRYVDLLCQLDHHDFSEQNLAETLPVLHVNNAWQGVFGRVRDCLADYSRRLQEAEHARARAEVRMRRLASEQEQIREILENLKDPVLAIDHYDELVLSNHSADKLFQIEPQPGDHPAVEQVVHCQLLLDLLTDTRRRKLPAQRSGEVEILDSEGRPHWYRVNCRGISTAAETEGSQRSLAHGAVAVLSDISDQKVIQKRNAEFVSAVSHEMKTPLTGIKAYVELLADGDAEDEETREEFLNVINSQADRLQRLINNLLSLARIEAGVVDVHKQQRSLNELLEEAWNVVQPAAEEKGISLKSDLSPMHLSVLVDRDMILQAAINLLSNAIKYTDPGGQVVLRSRLQHNEVVFEVEDSGVGLSEEDCHKIFQKFYRVQKDKQMAPGTGLGLPLAKHIVEDVHGGQLSVASKLGQGSTFRIALPNTTRLHP